ncbi:MAG: phosphoglycerate dehydrogenase [Lachnospiraceae bacterium]|nr:phosphoglycerate dehydrogenase [Lachnospiraceae bacterium]
MKKIVSFFGDRSDLMVGLNERAEAYAASLGLEYRWAPQLPFDEDDVVAELLNADAGIIDVEPYGEPIFSRIRGGAKLLVRYGVGYDKVDLAAASAAGIAIARTTAANASAVAEMALTLILTCRRRIKMSMSRTQSGTWAKDIGNEMLHTTVGIIGYGNIGRRLKKLLTGFECEILVYDPYLSAEAAEAEGVEPVPLEDLFRRADAVSIHVPYSPETHHLVGARELALMKPTAVIVNTARGNIIDEDALYEALRDGKIAGAGLDVFAAEPLPADSPLLTLDNAVLTPHNSSQTVESLWNIYKVAIDICADFFAGKDSPHILNPDYRR